MPTVPPSCRPRLPLRLVLMLLTVGLTACATTRPVSYLPETTFPVVDGWQVDVILSADPAGDALPGNRIQVFCRTRNNWLGTSRQTDSHVSIRKMQLFDVSKQTRAQRRRYFDQARSQYTDGVYTSRDSDADTPPVEIPLVLRQDGSAAVVDAAYDPFLLYESIEVQPQVTHLMARVTIEKRSIAAIKAGEDDLLEILQFDIPMSRADGDHLRVPVR